MLSAEGAAASAVPVLANLPRQPPPAALGCGLLHRADAHLQDAVRLLHHTRAPPHRATLGIGALAVGGQLVAITPRSFPNGPYFERFRKHLLGSITIDRMHTFESGSDGLLGDGRASREHRADRYAGKANRAPSCGEWMSYILGVPEFANDRFSELYAGGVLALTPLIVKSEGPETAASIAAGTTGPWAACLQGEIVEGFNLVLYEGGSVEDLAACAEGVGLAALYVLNDGVWISYIVGAPEFPGPSLPRGVPRRPRARYPPARRKKRTHAAMTSILPETLRAIAEAQEVIAALRAPIAELQARGQSAPVPRQPRAPTG